MAELQKFTLFQGPRQVESIINQVVRQATIIGIKQEVIQRKLKSSLNFTSNLFNEILNRQNMDNYDKTNNKFGQVIDQEPIADQLKQKLFSKITHKNLHINQFQRPKENKTNMKRANSEKLQRYDVKSNQKREIFSQKKNNHSLSKRPKQQRFFKIGAGQLYQNNEDNLKTIQNQLRQNKIFNQSIKKVKLTLQRPKTKVQQKEQFSFSKTINPIKYSLSEPKKIKKYKNNFNSINIKAQRGLKIYNFQKSQKVKQRQEEKRYFFQNYHEKYQGPLQEEKIIRKNGLKLKQQEQFRKIYSNSLQRNSTITIKQQNRRRSSTDIKSLSTTNSNSLKKIIPSKRLSRADPKMKIQLPILQKPLKKLKISTFHQRKSNIEGDQNCHVKLQNEAGYDFLLDKKPNYQKSLPKERKSKIRISLMSKQTFQNTPLQNLSKNLYFNKFVPDLQQ